MKAGEYGNKLNMRRVLMLSVLLCTAIGGALFAISGKIQGLVVFLLLGVSLPYVVILAVSFAVLPHELGHLIAAKANNFSITTLQLGFISFERTNNAGSWNWTLLSKLDVGGQVKFVPNHYENLGKRFVRAIRGAIYADVLVLALLAIWFWQSIKSGSAALAGMLCLAQAFAIVQSLQSRVLSSGHYTDGKWLRMYQESPAKLEQILATSYLSCPPLSNTLCEDQPAMIAEYLAGSSDGSESELAAMYFLAIHYFLVDDMNNYTRVVGRQMEILKTLSDDEQSRHKSTCHLNSALKAAYLDRNSKAATEVVNSSHSCQLIHQYYLILVEALCEKLDGNLESSTQLAAEVFRGVSSAKTQFINSTRCLLRILDREFPESVQPKSELQQPR